MASAADAEPPPADDCESALEAAPSGESLDLGTVCPGLVRWLDEQGYRAGIEPALDAIDDRGRARELLRLLPAPSESRPRAEIDRRALETIVADIRRQDPEPNDDQTNWFEEWVQQQLRELDWTPSDWFDDWAPGLASGAVWFVRFLYVVLGIGLLVLIMWLVKKAAERLAPEWLHAAGAAPARRVAEETDPSRLPARQQPGALLRRVIVDWRQRGLLTARLGRSNTELTAELSNAPPTAQQRFRRLATVAEMSTYAGRFPTESELEQCFEDASALMRGEGARA